MKPRPSIFQQILWVWLAGCLLGNGPVRAQTNQVFLETMAAAATSLWTGTGGDTVWTVTGNAFAQGAGWNYGSGNPCGLQFNRGTTNLADSTMSTASGIPALGSSGFVEFWIKTTGLTPNAGWAFLVNAGSGFVTRLSDLTGANHTYQLYHYDLQPGELVTNLLLQFQFAGAAATNHVDLDLISVSVAAPGSTADNTSLVLGRPTDNSIVINALAGTNLTAYFEYGTQAGLYTAVTSATHLTAGQPVEVVLSPLQPNTRYYYRLRYQAAGAVTFLAGAEHTFMTQRAPGSTFTFCIHGDSHPERTNNMYNPDFYALTLGTAAADQPDFYLTVGDDFSVDNIPTNQLTQTSVSYRYALQRQYLPIVASSAALFLVNGNHEQASLANLNNTNSVALGATNAGVTYSNVAVWAQNARNLYFPSPAPDGFYTGNTNPVPGIGLLRNYYAWTWGDALFVTIDPYWSSPTYVDNALGQLTHPTNNKWDVTHGDAQYEWLKTTLEQSAAKYKFVFAHHVMGTGRGGVEVASAYEWGGQNPDGTWGFATNRPAWVAPLHQLMVSNHVTIFFLGHDHIFVRQQMDNVTYQSLPNPADPNYSLFNSDAYTNYLYKTNNSGYTRVTVSPEQVWVEYVRTILPANLLPNGITNNAPPGVTNGTVAYRYELPAIPLLSGAIATNNLVLSWSARSGFNYIVQWSTNLLNWSSVPVGPTNNWADPNPIPPLPRRFYRLLW